MSILCVAPAKHMTKNKKGVRIMNTKSTPVTMRYTPPALTSMLRSTLLLFLLLFPVNFMLMEGARRVGNPSRSDETLLVASTR